MRPYTQTPSGLVKEDLGGVQGGSGRGNPEVSSSYVGFSNEKADGCRVWVPEVLLGDALVLAQARLNMLVTISPYMPPTPPQDPNTLLLVLCTYPKPLNLKPNK